MHAVRLALIGIGLAILSLGLKDLGTIQVIPTCLAYIFFIWALWARTK